MKIRFSILIVMVAFASTAFAQNNSLSGFVRYFNDSLTPMHDSTTVYLMQGSSAIYQTTVDNSGHFDFSGILAGTYTLKANSIKKNGGINALNALICLFCFVQNCPPYITGIRLQAIDVTGNGQANTADALAMMNFFVGGIPNFMPPYVPFPGTVNKWISETYTIQIQPNTTYTQDIKMICTGDANGSFVPY